MSDCPYCRQPGAEQLLWKVRCPNAACPKYDSSMSVGSLARTSRPMAGSRGKTGPIAGGADPARGKPFNWGFLFGGLMLVAGLAVLMGAFKAYIGNRRFIWGMALIYLGWKTIQGSNKGVEAETGLKKDGDGGISVDEQDEDGQDDGVKTARILYRTEEGLVEYLVLNRSVSVNGNEVSAMNSESMKWENFSAEKVANLEDVRQVARDNGQNYG